jgi:hypothetical protein
MALSFHCVFLSEFGAILAAFKFSFTQREGDARRVARQRYSELPSPDWLGLIDRLAALM